MVKFEEKATKQILNATSQSTIEEFRKRKDLYKEIKSSIKTENKTEENKTLTENQ